MFENERVSKKTIEQVKRQTHSPQIKVEALILMLDKVEFRKLNHFKEINAKAIWCHRMQFVRVILATNMSLTYTSVVTGIIGKRGQNKKKK